MNLLRLSTLVALATASITASAVMSSNGLVSNGLVSNGLTQNAMAVNGIATKGVEAGALHRTPIAPELFSWGVEEIRVEPARP